MQFLKISCLRMSIKRSFKFKGEIPNVVTGAALTARVQGEYDALAKVAKALGLSQ